MIKILLAMTFLSAGAGGILTIRQSTTRLQHEANAAREAWLTQTQLVAAAQREKDGLKERLGELKQTLAQTPTPAGSALWSALQTNRADRLPPELRERLMEELGFNWKASADFVVVSKETIRQLHMHIINQWKGELTETAVTVFALTPGEREQVETAIERVKTDFKDWVATHVQRHEPKDDVLAYYILPDDPALSISNNFATGLFEAVGRERAELVLRDEQKWMNELGLGRSPTTYTAVIRVKRETVGNEQRLKAETQNNLGTRSDYLPGAQFPKAFLSIFPNGWADVAQREGFELPSAPPGR